MRLSRNDRPKQSLRHLHAVADLIRLPPPRDRGGPARGMAQSGSASALGAEGRGFESLCPDHILKVLTGTWVTVNAFNGNVFAKSYIIRAHSRLRCALRPEHRPDRNTFGAISTCF